MGLGSERRRFVGEIFFNTGSGYNVRVKILIIVVLGVLTFALMFIAWDRWDSAQNRGNEFGYYGEYNRVSNALALIPGVAITQAWHNLDLTLEEFGFGITVTGRPVRLFFGETDHIRTMSRDAAITALKERIDTELSTTNK